MNSYWMRGDVAPYLLNLGTGWKRAVSFKTNRFTPG